MIKRLLSAYRDDLPVRTKLIIAFAGLSIFVTLCTGLLTYAIAYRRLEEAETRLLSQNLTRTASFLDFSLAMVEKKSEFLFSNRNVQKALGRDYSIEGMQAVVDAYQGVIYRAIDPLIQDLVYPGQTGQPLLSGPPGPPRIVIYRRNDSLPSDGDRVQDLQLVESEQWAARTRAVGGRTYWRSLFSSGSADYISVSRVMKDFDTLADLGILSILVPVTSLESILRQNDNTSTEAVFLVDDAGKAVATNERGRGLLAAGGFDSLLSLGPHPVIGRSRYLQARSSSLITGWSFVGLYSSASISARLRPLGLAIGIVLLVNILISIAITSMVAFALTRRLERIAAKMASLKVDRLNILEPIAGKDEVGRLDRGLMDMISTLNSLDERERSLLVQRNTLEVELLRAQINPHVLYNALATISWSARQAGLRDVGNATERLIRFFRGFLNRGRIASTVRQEVEMVQEYVKILRFTYGLDFADDFRIDDDVLDCASLSLILQPIVENAIIHGMRPSKRHCSLQVAARVSNDLLELRVEDDGVGMAEDIRAKLSKGEKAGTRGGCGLANVVRRIALYFGDPYGVAISSIPGSGTSVTIKLPVLHPDELDCRIQQLRP